MSVKAVIIFSVCMILNIGAAMYYVDYVNSRKKGVVAPVEIKTTGMLSQEAAVLAAGINRVIGESRQRDSAIMGEVMRTQHQLQMHAGRKIPLCPSCAKDGVNTKERFVSTDN